MREASLAPARGAAVRGRRKDRKSIGPGLRQFCQDAAFRLLRHHPGKMLGTVACIALMGGIAGNAVLMQKGRHPAPLFGSPVQKPPRSAAADPVPQPVPRPATMDPRPAGVTDAMADQGGATQPESAAETSPPPAAKPDRHPAKTAPTMRPAAKIDGIARLIEGKPIGDAEANGDSVRAAQKALSKLGYDIKPDGRMGSATRDALQKFEQDRHLDGDGTLSPKLLRTLEHVAGSSRG